MNYYVMTLFPEMVQQGLQTSIIGRAIENRHIGLQTINMREYSTNKHLQVDDYPYGGGAGMVIKPEPVYAAFADLKKKMVNPNPRVIYLTPQGKVMNQKMVKEFALEDELVFLCGHYEGIDERVLELIVTDEVSIGDYVLTGGELAAMVAIDAISRMVPGVLSNELSAESESLEDNLLEYPQYTRPVEFMGKQVPPVLLSGHHANIAAWRKEQSLFRTEEKRPDLYAAYENQLSQKK